MHKRTRNPPRNQASPCKKSGISASQSSVKTEQTEPATSPPKRGGDLPDLEPWPDPVNGAELLEELRAPCNRFLVLPTHVDVLLAVWKLHTYVFECFDFTPYLHVSSPVKECGKSTLADLLARLCHNATTPGGMSAAAMRRLIHAKPPTLLLDEWDTLSPDARAAALHTLNTGFKYNGAYTICVGNDFEPKTFRTFCPKALFGLAVARLPDTTRSRCIQIRMHRKQAGQQVERLTKTFTGEEPRRKCLRWALDNRAVLEKAAPVFPPNFGSREEDISFPLLAIADACGGHWPGSVRAALTALFAAETTEEPSPDIELLADVRRLFDERKTPRLSTAEIRAWLNGKDDSLDEPREYRQWAEWNNGTGITQRQLAMRLRNFGIQSRDIKLAHNKVVKGIRLEDCEEAFAKYLPPPEDFNRYSATKAENIGDSASSDALPSENGSTS